MPKQVIALPGQVSAYKLDLISTRTPKAVSAPEDYLAHLRDPDAFTPLYTDWQSYQRYPDELETVLPAESGRTLG